MSNNHARHLRIFGLAGALNVALIASPSLVVARVRAHDALRDARQVMIVATDFAYRMPDTLQSGWTAFHLRNDGAANHHIIIYRLDAGKSADDAMALLKAHKAFPAWMHALGGPQVTVPHGEALVYAELMPGNYVAYCNVHTAENVSHAALGMVKPFTVVAAAQRDAPAVLPRPDIEVALTEYAFTFSKPITPGHHTISVANNGSQPHEMILSRLAPGKTMADYAEWNKTQFGPPPVIPVSGVTDLAAGARVTFEATFKPGHYLARCRVLDSSDDKGHDLHGMIKQFDVE